MTTSAWSSSRVPEECPRAAPRDSVTDVTAITGRPRRRAPIAISMGLAVTPRALNTTIASGGDRWKLRRMTSASPSTRSMNIAWRWPLVPTTWVWKVVDSSTIGWKPGYDP
jgi:hypothetical protein